MRTILSVVFGLLLAAQCQAQTAGIEPTLPATLDELLVLGELPSPPIWKVTRSDSGHVFWIVAAPPLLPQDIAWHSQHVEELAISAQEIVFSGGFGIVPDGKVGFFKILSLVPSVFGARKNPNGERLQDLVSKDLYTRWLAQKKLYIGNDSGVEKWRPMFAAQSLVNEAVSKYRSHEAPELRSILLKIAKDRSIKTTTPSITIKISPKNMRSAIKQFSQHSLDDLDCFERSLEFVEALKDEANIRTRAIAWANGDISALRKTQAPPRYAEACQAVLFRSESFQQYDVSDGESRLRNLWLDATEKSLEANETTMAILSLTELLSDGGFLATLRSRGYVIEEP